MEVTTRRRLAQTLGQVRERLACLQERGERISEQDTKAGLIEPVLSALGWGFDDVRREYKSKPQDNPVDYALLIYRTPRLFVEAKALGTPLDQKCAGQVLGYASIVGVTWCLLTNGDEYRLYNAHAAVPVEEKLFRSMKLSEADDDARCLDTLELIARERLDDSPPTLEWLWKCQFVDRRVKNTVSELFSEPSPKLVKLVRQTLPDLSPSDIRESLGRATLQLHYPADELPQKKAHGVTPKPKPQKMGKPVVANSIELSHLIEANLITPPLHLECRYKGVDLEATVEADGRVRFQQQDYATPSAAGGAAKRSVIGPPGGSPLPTNGWEFWRYRDADEGLHVLSELRHQYLRAQVEATEG